MICCFICSIFSTRTNLMYLSQDCHLVHLLTLSSMYPYQNTVQVIYTVSLISLATLVCLQSNFWLLLVSAQSTPQYPDLSHGTPTLCIQRDLTQHSKLGLEQASYTPAEFPLFTWLYSIYTISNLWPNLASYHLFSLSLISENKQKRGQWGGSEVESIGCFATGPNFSSQQTHVGSWPSVVRSAALFCPSGIHTRRTLSIINK